MPLKNIDKKREYDRQRYHGSAEVRARKLENRYNHRLRQLNLSREEYENMLKVQQFSCKICKKENSGRKGSLRLCLDHCHETNTPRGLLCSRCNQGLGLFLDNPELLRSAADYLNNFKGVHKTVDHAVL